MVMADQRVAASQACPVLSAARAKVRSKGSPADLLSGLRLEEGEHPGFRPGLYLLSASGVRWSVLDVGGHTETCVSRVHGNLVAACGMNVQSGITSD